MIRRVWIGALLLLTALLATYRLEEPDLWFHLALGRHIVTHRTIPSEDPFVYSSPPTGAAWLRMHWLWQTVVFLIYERVGIVGLNVLKVGLITAIVAAALAVSRAGPWALMLAPPSIGLMAWRFHARPELVTWALLVIFVTVLEQERRRPTRWLWSLPVATVLWVNVHIYFVLGWVVIFAYLVETLWERRNLGVRLDPLQVPHGRLIVVLVACIAAALFNPTGLAGVILPFQYLVDIARQGGIHLRTIHEQQPLLVNDWFRSSGLWGAYWSVVVLSIVGWMVSVPRRVAHAMLLVFVAAFSWLAVRNVPLLALGAVALAPVEVASRWHRRLGAVWRAWNPATRRAVRGVALASVIAVTAAFSVQIVSGRWYLERERMRQFGVGVADCLFPDRGVGWLEARGWRGRLFANFDAAGYLIWRRPDWPVYMHGCADFRSERFRDYIRLMEAPEGSAGWLQAQGVDAVLLAHTAQDTDGLILRLARDPSWRLVYLDETAVIFAAAATNLPTFAAASDALTRVTVGPSGSVPWLWASYFRGRVLGLLGWVEEAIAVLGRARQRYPDAALLARRLGYLYARQGRTAEAVAAYEQALALTPNEAIACYNLGLLYLQQGRPEAADLFRRAVRYQPSLAVAHYQLALWYAYSEPADRRAAHRHLRVAQRLGLVAPSELLRRLGETVAEPAGGTE